MSTAIASDTTAAVEPLLAVGDFFGLHRHEARTILREVAEATSAWREVAEQFELGKAAIGEMSPAFEHEQAAAARRVFAG